MLGLALDKNNFDTVKEYISAYKDLIDPRDRIVALQTLMKYQFPQIKDMEYKEIISSEKEALEDSIDPKDQETSQLLDALNVINIKR